MSVCLSPSLIKSVCRPQAFELATGDYLFEPHSGEDYSRDEGTLPNAHNGVELILHTVNRSLQHLQKKRLGA